MATSPAATEPVEHVETINGSELHYWTYGSNDLNSSRAPVVMIHGLRGTHEGLELIAMDLAERGERNVVVPDLPGFGLSGPMVCAPHDVAGYAEAIVALLEKLGCRGEPAILLGHSFGSIVAARVAAAAPELIPKLVMINPISTSALRGPRAVLTRLVSAYYWLGRALPVRAGRAVLSNKWLVLATSWAMVRSKDRRMRRFVHGSHLRHFNRFHSPAVLGEVYDASVWHTVFDDVDAVTMPSLLIAGETDDIAPLAGQRRLDARMSDSELVVIPDVGHLVHYETPREAAAEIHRFASR